MVNTTIIAAGKSFDIGCRVILWNEPGGYSFYKHNSVNLRDISYEDLNNKLTCFVVHYSNTYRSKNTYDILNMRGLSANFIIDDDVNNGCATIYQCADIKDVCKTHGIMNNFGSGVEISYQPDAFKNSELYSETNQKKYNVQPHNIVTDYVHGVRVSKVFTPTAAQVEACSRLAWGYTNLFPNIIPFFPRDKDKNIIRKSLSNIYNYKGLIGHYHITRQKPDPVGFPFETLEKRIQELNGNIDSETISQILQAITQ